MIDLWAQFDVDKSGYEDVCPYLIRVVEKTRAEVERQHAEALEMLRAERMQERIEHQEALAEKDTEIVRRHDIWFAEALRLKAAEADVQRLTGERDAMQRRAEAAESDWLAELAGARIEHD